MDDKLGPEHHRRFVGRDWASGNGRRHTINPVIACPGTCQWHTVRLQLHGVHGQMGRRRSVRGSCIRHRHRAVMASSSKRRRRRHAGDWTPVSPRHDVCLAASTRRLSVCLSFVLNTRVCHSSSPSSGIGGRLSGRSGHCTPSRANACSCLSFYCKMRLPSGLRFLSSSNWEEQTAASSL